MVLRLFGPPSALVDDRLVARELGTSKCMALLVYLSLESGRHSREELATLLWGDSGDTAARTSLRQAIKRIRDTLGDRFQVDRHDVELVGPLECDVLAFRRAAGRNPAEAARFDVDDFLQGFVVRKAPGFEDWADRTRTTLMQQFHTTLRTASHEAIEESRWQDAVTWGNRWLESDPLSDDASRIVIEAVYLSGDRAAALSKYAEYSERVVKELGSPPSSSLQALAERIERESRPGLIMGGGQPGERPTFEGSVVGRQFEWQTE